MHEAQAIMYEATFVFFLRLFAIVGTIVAQAALVYLIWRLARG